MNSNIRFKIRNNSIFKNGVASISLFLGLIFFLLIAFITLYAIQGFIDYGFDNILLTGKFNDVEKSFWLPFSITLLTSLIALIIAMFFGVRTAIFIKYRMNEKYSKWARIIFETLSGIPSVMFGLFAINSFGWLFNELLGINSRSILNASIMLSFMVLPTIISMTLNALNSVDDNLLSNPIALGNTKTRSIYKVCKKSINSNILIIAIIAFSRAIGESMAMSMILQAGPNTLSTSVNGFFDIFTSGTQSLGAFISTNMFSDSNPEKIRPLLYTFGFILLILVMLLNIFITIYSHRKNKTKHPRVAKFINDFHYGLTYIPYKICYFIEYISSSKIRKIDNSSIESKIEYAKSRNNSYKLSSVYSIWKVFLEILSITICTAFLFWIFGDILVNGFIALFSDGSTSWIITKNSVGQSFFITLLIIIVTMIIAFPISLCIAIYLSEYVKNERIKNTITFFIDSISATPSILFGMFGMLFFINTLGLSIGGKQGNSLIAGVLTLSIVILPTFIRTLEQAFKSVPNELRLNSYALGNTKFETIRKIVIPTAFKGIVTSLVLCIGRILSETAPLYLTAGLSSSWQIALDRPGTTLTIQIYAQEFNPSTNRLNTQYEAAILTLFLVLLTVILGYVIIPNWKEIKEKIIVLSMRIKNLCLKIYNRFFGKKGIIIYA